LRDRLAPAGGSSRKFRFDFGADVAGVRRYCAKLEIRMLLHSLRRCRPAALWITCTGQTLEQWIEGAA
jgi:hypothetical protein